MNDLQKLLKLRNITMQKLADAIGRNMHPTQKAVKGTLPSERIQPEIAHFIGLTREQAFGPKATKYLHPLIKAEIVKIKEELCAKLKAEYLPSHKNRIADMRKTGNG